MKKTNWKPWPRILVIAALLLAGAAALRPDSARANLSARYGVGAQPRTYRTRLPFGARPVFIANRRYFLSEGVYYQPIMYQGRVVYAIVDTTWQR